MKCIKYKMEGGDNVNKEELFRMYLTEDLKKDEENSKKWQECYEYYLQLPRTTSKELITYYKTKAEVALKVFEYKQKCYNNYLLEK